MHIGTIGHYRAAGDESLAVVTNVVHHEGRPELVDLTVFPRNPRGAAVYTLQSIPTAPAFGPSPSMHFHRVEDCPEGL